MILWQNSAMKEVLLKSSRTWRMNNKISKYNTCHWLFGSCLWSLVPKYYCDYYWNYCQLQNIIAVLPFYKHCWTTDELIFSFSGTSLFSKTTKHPQISHQVVRIPPLFLLVAIAIISIILLFSLVDFFFFHDTQLEVSLFSIHLLLQGLLSICLIYA